MTDTNQRESRHVHVSGVPDDWDDDRVMKHFGGRVQRVERTAPSEFMVSFLEVRTAKKHIAENVDPNLKIVYYEPGSLPSSSVNQYNDGNDNDRQRKPRSGSSSPRPSGDRIIRPHSAQDQHRRKPSSANSNSPKHRSIGSPISHYSSASSSGRRTSANDESPTMSRKLTKSDQEGESTTLHTIRFDKLPSTLLVPWERQRKDILDLVGKYSAKTEIAVDAVENERQDRKATLFLSLFPGVSIDTVVRSINTMHIETTPVIARVIPGNEPSTSSLPPPPQVPVLISKSAGDPGHGGFIPTDLSHIEPTNKAASRTLHVRNLERRVTVELLKEKFGKIAEIIDVEIKNPESPSPYAFIQFPDVHSVIETIKHYYSSREHNRSRYKLNWGKTKTSSKLWIGQLPRGIAKEQIASKIRSATAGDEVLEVIFDPPRQEAIIVFRHKDAATKVLENLKNKLTFTSCQELLHIDYCSDKLHDHFVGRINSDTLPQPPVPPPQIHGYSSQQPPPPQRIIIDTSQPPPPIPPPPNPPRELINPVGIETASGGSTPAEMGYRRHYRSPTPEYDRRRERDRHRDRRERDRRSRSRSRGRRHDRRSRSRDGDRRRERERKRSKSMSSVSSASSESVSSGDSRRRHGHRSSRDSRRHREHVDRAMAISSGSESLEPPPLPPQIEHSTKMEHSHHQSTSSHQTSQQQSGVRRHSNEVVPPPPQPPAPASKTNIPPMSKETAAQMQKARNEKVSTPKRVYFAKPFVKSFKIPELDPRPRPLPSKSEDRIVLRGWGDFTPRRLSTENSSQIRKPNFNLPPLTISDDMRPRLSSTSSLNTPTPSSSSASRVQERLERLLKKDDCSKKPSTSALHVDTTSVGTPTSSAPTPTSTNRTEMLQHTLSAAALKSPSLLSPSSRRQSTNNIPTPSPISRQTSLVQPQLSQTIGSPISSTSALSTPKMSSGASPRSNLVTPTYQMSILKGAKMPSNPPTQSQSASGIKDKPVFPGVPKPNASAPGSKVNTPTTPYSGHKFAPTPTTPSKGILPLTPQPKPKLPTTPGLPPLTSKDQKPKTPVTTPDANKKIMEKKASSSTIPITPPVSGTSASKSTKPGEKDKDAAIANSWRERQQEKMRKDSAMAAAFNATKRTSKSEKSLHQIQSGFIEKKKKKKLETEEKGNITDEYMKALTSAGRKDSILDKEKEKERRRQEKKEAKRKARELEARREAKLQKKEKKKKKRRESDDSDSCDPMESSVRKKIDKEYKDYLQEGGEGAIGLSMYDRVKRRTSGAKDDDAKRKQEALELIKKKKEKEKKRLTFEDSSGDESSSKQTIGHQVSLENDSEAASSTTSQSSQKKKKIGAIEKERFEEKKRKKEKERREQEKLKKKQTESKTEKLKSVVPDLSSTEDSLDKIPLKSKKSETESEDESPAVSGQSRRESLQKQKQKNVLKRIKRRRQSSNSEEEEPESPQKIDMSDVFGGDSGSDGERKKGSSMNSEKKKKKDKKLAKEEEKRREEKRLKKEKKKKKEEDSSAVEKDIDKESELKKKKKEEKKKLQEKEEKRKLKEQKRLEAEKEARKLKKAKKLLEESSRKRKHQTDESDTPAEITPKAKKPPKKSRSPISKLDDVIDNVRLGENMPMDISSTSESPKSTIASSVKVSASPLASPVSSKKAPSVKSPNLTQPLKTPTMTRSPSMSSSASSDSSSAPTKVSEPLPPVREETPIPVPLVALQRRVSKASAGSRTLLSSGDSSADEEALLLAMNSDSQETAQAAEIVQRQMEQEAAVAVDHYHYGPGRIMEKKRESDASIDPELVRNSFNSIDRRSSQDSSGAQSIMQSPHLRNLPPPIQSPSLMVGTPTKSVTPEQLMEFIRQVTPQMSPLTSPVSTSNELLRRQIQFQNINRLHPAQKTSNPLQSPQAVFNFMQQQIDAADKKPHLNIGGPQGGSATSPLPGPSSTSYRKPSDPKPSDVFVSQLQLSPEDPSKGAIDDIVNSIAHDREDQKKQKLQKESTPTKTDISTTSQSLMRTCLVKGQEGLKLPIKRPCSMMSLATVSDNGIDPSFIEPQKEKQNTSSDFTSGTQSAESVESTLGLKVSSDVENISQGTVVTVYDDAMKVIPEDETHARVNKQYPVLWEGLLQYKEESYPIQFHSVVVFKNDFRPFLSVLTEYSTLHQMKTMKVRQRCKMDEKSRFHNIVAKTVFSQNVPFHLMLGVLGERTGRVTQEHVSGMKKLFFSRDGAEPAGCICTALAAGDRQVALHLMLKSAGTERVLRYYAPNLRNYLTDRNITYVLGILCFDFINNKEGYEKMKNLIPVTLPKNHIMHKWLLETKTEEPESAVEVAK